eukprot:sb/3478902/
MIRIKYVFISIIRIKYGPKYLIEIYFDFTYLWLIIRIKYVLNTYSSPYLIRIIEINTYYILARVCIMIPPSPRNDVIMTSYIISPERGMGVTAVTVA